jgi:quinolinate synthase
MTESLTAAAHAAALYNRVRHVILHPQWLTFEDDIDAILALKRERNAIILAHNYQAPEIFHRVADIVRAASHWARKATRTEAATIVLAGVPFMAEIAKLPHPDKTVLIPDLGASCSLAELITPVDVRLVTQRRRSNQRRDHRLERPRGAAARECHSSSATLDERMLR